jgi:hypothetical protein
MHTRGIFEQVNYENWRLGAMQVSKADLFRWADQIPAALWDALDKRDPKDAAGAVGAVNEGSTFRLSLIGIDYIVDTLGRRIKRSGEPEHPVSYQTGIVLITTLTLSSGVPPSGRIVSPQELPGGRMFFTGAHALPTGKLVKAFEKDPKGLIERALGLGGKIIAGADTAIQVPGLPYVPLYLFLWRGEEDIPPRATIGIDDRAHFHLDLGGVFAMTNILAARLCGP